MEAGIGFRIVQAWVVGSYSSRTVCQMLPVEAAEDVELAADDRGRSAVVDRGHRLGGRPPLELVDLDRPGCSLEAGRRIESVPEDDRVGGHVRAGQRAGSRCGIQRGSSEDRAGRARARVRRLRSIDEAVRARQAGPAPLGVRCRRQDQGRCARVRCRPRRLHGRRGVQKGVVALESSRGDSPVEDVAAELVHDEVADPVAVEVRGLDTEALAGVTESEAGRVVDEATGAVGDQGDVVRARHQVEVEAGVAVEVLDQQGRHLDRRQAARRLEGPVVDGPGDLEPALDEANEVDATVPVEIDRDRRVRVARERGPGQSKRECDGLHGSYCLRMSCSGGLLGSYTSWSLL